VEEEERRSALRAGDAILHRDSRGQHDAALVARFRGGRASGRDQDRRESEQVNQPAVHEHLRASASSLLAAGAAAAASLRDHRTPSFPRTPDAYGLRLHEAARIREA